MKHEARDAQSGQSLGTATRIKALVARAAGPVPGRYWLFVYALFAVVYIFWHHYGRPYSGDHLYYTAMTFRYAGYSLPDALRLTAEYFQELNIERLYYGFEDPDFSPLIYPRVVYPALSVPFVLAMGGTGMYVVPLIASIFTIWGLIRLLTRLFTKEIALVVTSVFVLTYAFQQFSTGLFTEGPVLALVVGLALLLPLDGRSFGLRESVVGSLLIVLLTFTRQSAPIAVSAVCAAWLWTSVFERRIRGNPWNLPVAVFLPVGLACTFFLQWWAPYNPFNYFLHRTGEPDVVTGMSHFHAHAWRLLTRDASYFQDDLGMLALWLLAGASVLAMFRSPRTGLLIGGLAPSLFLATINTRPTQFRYYLPMYPFLIIAAAGMLYFLFINRRRIRLSPSREPGTTQPVDGQSQPAQSVEA